MRVLAIADIHGYEGASYLIDEIYGSYKFDIILIAGDITNFGSDNFALKFLDSLPTDALVVPGNCDPPGIIRIIEKSKAKNIHKKVLEYKNLNFVGLGGTNGKGFSMGILFDEDFAFQFLSKYRNSIFLTHQPPYGILDEVGRRHIGSKGIRRAVDITNPKLVIFGHAHEARGYKIKNGTIFVNPGPAKMGYASIIDLKLGKVEMIEI